MLFRSTVVLDKYDWHYNFESFSNYIVTDVKEAADVIWSAYTTWTVDKEKVEAEFKEYQTQYETQLLDLVNSSNVLNNAKTEPRNRLYVKLKDSKGTWVSLSEYFKTENTKGVIYLTSDIESIYLNRKWYQVTHTDETTYLGIADDNGNLEFPIENVSESLSSFFE